MEKEIKRCVNFNSREKDILLSLVQKYVKCLENKKTNAVAWEFNSSQTSGFRTEVKPIIIYLASSNTALYDQVPMPTSSKFDDSDRDPDFDESPSASKDNDSSDSIGDENNANLSVVYLQFPLFLGRIVWNIPYISNIQNLIYNENNELVEINPDITKTLHDGEPIL
ncbi:unnamed protein product [Psylliodes chrysocephalus]|uniref:Regulatory protein zeste n=1 Tax=Psylliodes chrysocephalus TaxID=3402493 RepID=A0A9P0CVA8_9CUCU|nr:unnamed protein product [Psylliodes chrysocephala]